MRYLISHWPALNGIDPSHPSHGRVSALPFWIEEAGCDPQHWSVEFGAGH